MYIELFKSADGWRWRLKGGNHEILATSEAYTDRDAALRTAGMKAGQEFGLIGSYLWGQTVAEITEFLLHFGPVQFGTAWTDGMSTTTPQGWIEVEDAQLNARDVEGHAWTGTGVDVRLKCPDGSRGAIRMEQTWGRDVYGVDGTGRAWMSFKTLEKVMAVDGECAMPTEIKVTPA